MTIVREGPLVTAGKLLRKDKGARHDCKICSQRALGGAEIYELRGPGGTSIFDVDKAKQIISDSRRPELVSVNALTGLVADTEYDHAHMAHVDAGKPGILGQRFSGLFLLDGMHRAARCLQEKRDFYAFALSQEETLSCLVLQDLWESNVGMVVRELRRLLEDHPDAAYLEVNLDCGPRALEQIKRLLTPAENARIRILSAG